MKKFLSFFSPKPTAPFRLLFTFLQQCQRHNGYLMSSLATGRYYNEHHIVALFRSLRLSLRDTIILITGDLLPLSESNLITMDDVFTTLRNKDQPAFPCQVCDNCAPGLFEHYGYNVADTSWCSQCFKRGECLDVPLIEHYRKYGIDDYTIWRYIPRKRCQSDIYPLNLRYCSIEDIETFHQALFDAFKAQMRLMALEEAKPKKPIERERWSTNTSPNDVLRQMSLS